MPRNLAKSILHNISVVIVGFGVAFVCARLDLLIALRDFRSTVAMAGGGLLLCAGFLLRAWATFYFYQHRIKVISLEPQAALIISGPYAFSRNPLYLDGNVFIFFGAGIARRAHPDRW
jgi:protein-S-isoprenylcysteine O-methyltransferase Ste14